MEYSLRRHLYAGLGTVLIVLLFIPVLLTIFLTTYIASIPSRVGKRVPIEDWLFRVVARVVDVDLMCKFRDDTFHRIRQHIAFEDDVDRWWVIREIDLARERTNRQLQSGEYVIVLLLAAGSMFLNASLYGIPMSIILTLLAVALSGMILVRLVLFKVLAFRSKNHLEDSTYDLRVRMAFNKGPFSQGSSIGIALLAVFVGATGGIGYQTGMEWVEKIAAKRHPADVERWEADGD